MTLGVVSYGRVPVRARREWESARGGEAIGYQVRQILNLAEELGLLED